MREGERPAFFYPARPFFFPQKRRISTETRRENKLEREEKGESRERTRFFSPPFLSSLSLPALLNRFRRRKAQVRSEVTRQNGTAQSAHHSLLIKKIETHRLSFLCHVCFWGCCISFFCLKRKQFSLSLSRYPHY